MGAVEGGTLEAYQIWYVKRADYVRGREGGAIKAKVMKSNSKIKWSNSGDQIEYERNIDLFRSRGSRLAAHTGSWKEYRPLDNGFQLVFVAALGGLGEKFLKSLSLSSPRAATQLVSNQLADHGCEVQDIQ